MQNLFPIICSLTLMDLNDFSVEQLQNALIQKMHQLPQNQITTSFLDCLTPKTVEALTVAKNIHTVQHSEKSKLLDAAISQLLTLKK